MICPECSTESEEEGVCICGKEGCAHCLRIIMGEILCRDCRKEREEEILNDHN